MKKFLLSALRILPIATLLTTVWCIWSESFALQTLLTGLLLSILALVITNRVFLRRTYQERYRLSIITLCHYIMVLIREIFRSGFHAIYITLTDRMHVGVVDLPTEIKDPLLGSLVASAITLTPGTVTIDFTPGCFKVVWIDCSTTDEAKAADMIKGGFENVLLQKYTNKKQRKGGTA